jgi:uncharacterized SAM-binding protein YcdF (DUF218 family)
MFLFKKIVAPLFFPVPLCLEILLLGLILLWFSKKQKAGKIIVSVGVALIIMFSFGTIQDILLHSLENKYPPLLNIQEVHDVRWVVVLGGGNISDPKLPANGQISGASLSRLVEGIRIQKKLPKCKLILSGGKTFDNVPNAEVMADVASMLGISDSDMVLESDSKDTKDEAILIKKIVKNEKFILVTSASHMLRSMALFQKLGMQPIPAPIDHAIKTRHLISPSSLFPNSGKISNAERIVYEYLGLVWAKLRGQI